MSETALITVSQLPVIQEELRALKERWELKAADAASMVCTEDTVQDLKKIRADMRKEFDAADTQRKAAKAQYMAPWDAIEATFKECVKDAFTKADNSLKETISGFENQLKKQCEWALREYFAELIEAENIDFLTFEKAMELGKIKISMAEAKRSTPRQAQDALAAVVSNIAVGMEQISQMDDAPAIMAEFKQCFDVGRSVATVQARRKREQEEAEAAEARKRAQEAQAAAVAKVQAAAPAKVVAAPEMSETAQSSPTLQPVPFTVPAEDPVFPEFTFTVYGARKSQLVQIRDFLKQEGIRYE